MDFSISFLSLKSLFYLMSVLVISLSRDVIMTAAEESKHFLLTLSRSFTSEVFLVLLQQLTVLNFTNSVDMNLINFFFFSNAIYNSWLDFLLENIDMRNRNQISVSISKISFW